MLILNIQRMSTEDGPGLRTTLFVKGCPLACKWCHNPESISFNKQIEWIKVRCIGCGICAENCPNNALITESEGITIQRDKCKLCLKCARECPTLAIEVKGESKSADELYDELIKDRAYFGTDGGVTLSGGEILSQAGEAAELLRKLKSAGINTAVDTSGYCGKEDIDKVLPYTDLFLYDIKLMDDGLHKEFTGKSNGRILDNFNYLAEKVKDTGAKIWIRTPIIPGATDTVENIEAIAKLISGRADRWELCAFNNLCRDKYSRLNMKWEFYDSPLMEREQMDLLLQAAKSSGIETFWTGAVKLNEEVV
ncbi:MAG: glycyl-radical enzyme activating protein [Christensenellales bacterium]|jgi:pyruvate formate lyase activating enzyme